MKRYSFLLLLVSAMLACQNQLTKEVEVSTKTFMVDAEKHEVDTAIIGKEDTAFVVKEKLKKGDMGGDREVYEINILFSNKKWPTLTYKNAIGADLCLVGDINGDNKPELLLRPEWFSSCWANINLFSIKDNAWQLIKTGSMYYCSDKYPLSKRIEKQNDKYYLLTDSMANDKFIIDRKEIEF